MPKANATRTNKPSVTTRAPRRERREFKPRGPRTYYATSKDGMTVYRFGSHAQRLAAVQRDKLTPLGALEYRNKILEDVDGKLTVMDLRAQAVREADDLPQLAAGANPEAMASAIVKALRPWLSGTVLTGEQPRGTRVVANH